MSGEKTKYENIVRSIVERIKAGVLPSGTKLPGQFALAKEYQVSAITANRALDELRELGFVERRERSGSFVCSNLRFVRKVVILISNEQGDPEPWLRLYFDELYRINEATGVSTVIMNQSDPEVSATIFKDPFSLGVILAGFEKLELVRKLEKSGIPHLVLGVRARYGKFNVTENRMDAARLLTERLYQDGARKMLYIGHFDQPNHLEALEGYRLEHSQHTDARLMELDSGNLAIRELLDELEKLKPRPDAIIVMGGSLPFQLLPFLNTLFSGASFGFFTENPTILNLKGFAYLSVYSQRQVGALASAMLEDIATGRLQNATTKFAEVEIIPPTTRDSIE